MALEQKDFEVIERLVYKNADDVAVSIARSFERLEEHTDAVESRLFSRMAEIQDRIQVCEDNVMQEIDSIREVLR